MAGIATDFDVSMGGVLDSETEPLCAAENHDIAHLMSKVRFPSCRLVLMIMGFLGFVNVYSLRVNLSVALVDMVNHTDQPNSNISHNFSGDICLGEVSIEGNASDSNVNSGEFNWDSHTQGTVLAAFFYGYILTQV